MFRKGQFKYHFGVQLESVTLRDGVASADTLYRVMWKKGELQPLLEAAGAKPAGEPAWNGYANDPFEFLPKWMTKNPMRTK